MLHEDRDRIALGLIASSMDEHGPRRDWFHANVAAVLQLTPEDDRLRLIFLAMKALAELGGDDDATLIAARQILLACFEKLGVNDPTTQAFALTVVIELVTAPDTVDGDAPDLDSLSVDDRDYLRPLLESAAETFAEMQPPCGA